MLKLKSLLKSNLFFLLLVTALFALSPQEAWSAEGVFETVRQKAASSLKDVKLVVYILGGFGLIGFSFMAIFNKISWKWFANIAISLFLLSVMGLFIDDFTGTDEHAALLDYGDYLSEDNSISGSDGNIGGSDTGELPGGGGDTGGDDTTEPFDMAECEKKGEHFNDNICVQYRISSGMNMRKCSEAGGILAGDVCTKTDGSGSVPVDDLY